MNIGIIGLGRMGGTMANTINKLNDRGIFLSAVASTSLTKALAFKEKYHARKACKNGISLIQNPNVDLVYIATPHSAHEKYVREAILNKKPVLCEKPFTTDSIKAEELIKLAEYHQTFLAEAMWTRYMPSRKMIAELIEKNIIGQIKMIRADLSYSIEYKERLVDPKKGGGAFLDLGVYPINFVSMFIKDNPIKIISSCTYTENHLDETDMITLVYPDNVIAVLSCSMGSFSDKKGIIQGTKGYIEVDNINNPLEIKVFLNNSELIKDIKVEEQISGYEYELLECKKCLEKGDIESESMPLSETLRMHKLYDTIRKELKIVYPFDSKSDNLIN